MTNTTLAPSPRLLTRKQGDSIIRQAVVNRGGTIETAERVLSTLEFSRGTGMGYCTPAGEMFTVNPRTGKGRGAHYIVRGGLN